MKLIMKKKILCCGFLLLSMIAETTFAEGRYGENYCSDPRFTCHEVGWNESWSSLFPNLAERDVVMRVNRLNIPLHAGLVIAIPKNLERTSLYDVAPFPLRISPPGRKTIIVELNKLAWGAYNPNGRLVIWGPASGGKGYCEDQGSECRTPTGNFQVQYKKGYQCVSEKFPIPVGGAAMPFCMHFDGAYAMHGSFEVPGTNASHGCVRMFINDARWLNKNSVSYTHLRAHETRHDIVCRLLLE